MARDPGLALAIQRDFSRSKFAISKIVRPQKCAEEPDVRWVDMGSKLGLSLEMVAQKSGSGRFGA